jgi:SAM-dependent methyltransferase
VSVDEKLAVREHWEADPCGAKLADSEPGTAAFFREVEEKRYALEPFIHRFAEFSRRRDQDVLEIGVGLGTDFVQFARNGARLQGIDLTEAAVALVRTRLELEGLDANVQVGDAERLPFPDNSFDLVYSWGVLHHTPDTHAAVDEVRRVLRPGGEARIMLYARHSWFAYGVWARNALLRGRPFRSLADVLAHHLESPGTKAYTPTELRELFGGFASVRLQRFVTPYDRWVSGPIATLTGPRLGWFVGVIAS